MKNSKLANDSKIYIRWRAMSGNGGVAAIAKKSASKMKAKMKAAKARRK